MTSMTAMRLVSAALSFLFVVSIARLWGAEPMGQFSLLLSFFIFLQQMPLMGLHLVVVRDTAAHPETVPVQIVNAVLIALATALMLALLLGVSGSYVYRDNDEMSASMWLVALSIIPTGFVCVVESVLIGQQRMHLVAGWNVAENVVRTTASFAAVWLGMDLTAVFAVFLIGRLLIAGGYFHALDFGTLVRGVRPTWEAISAYLRQIPTFLGIMVCAAAINRLDFMLLSALGSMRELGLYSAPYKVYEVALMAPSLITVVLMPVFSGHFHASHDTFDELFEATTRILLIAAMPCVGIGAFYAGNIMSVFGQEYVGTAWILQLMLISILFVTVNQLLSLAMLVSHHQQLDFKAVMWSCIAYAILLLLTIPSWGLAGAALSTFATAFLQPLLRYVMLRKKVRLPRLGPMLGTTGLAGAVMFAFYFALAKVAPWIAPVVALAAYAAVIWILKGITVENLRGYQRLVVGQGR